MAYDVMGDWAAGDLNVGYPDADFTNDSGVRKLFPGIVQRFEVNETYNKNTYWGLGGGRTGPRGITKTKYEVNGRLEWQWCQDTYNNSPFLWLFFQDPGSAAPYTISPANNVPKTFDLEMTYGAKYRYIQGAVVDSMTINIRENEIVTGEISFLARKFQNTASGVTLQSGVYGTPIVASAGNVSISTLLSGGSPSEFDEFIVQDAKLTFKNNATILHNVNDYDYWASAVIADKFEAQIDLTFLPSDDYGKTAMKDVEFEEVDVVIGNTTIKFKDAQITSPFPVKISSDMGLRKETYTFVPKSVEVVINA